MEDKEDPITPELTEKVTTISEDIEKFDRELEGFVEELNTWRSKVSNLQQDFIEKLKIKTLAMKIK